MDTSKATAPLQLVEGSKIEPSGEPLVMQQWAEQGERAAAQRPRREQREAIVLAGAEDATTRVGQRPIRRGRTTSTQGPASTWARGMGGGQHEQTQLLLAIARLSIDTVKRLRMQTAAMVRVVIQTVPLVGLQCAESRRRSLRSATNGQHLCGRRSSWRL